MDSVIVVPADRHKSMAAVDGMRNVGVATELRLINVDDVRELFHVGILIHTHFRINKIKPNPKKPDEFLRDDSYDDYLPKIILVNMVESQFQDFDVTVRVNHRTGDVWAAFQNTCYINESLELQTFPFDRQLFRVSFKSPNALLNTWALDDDILDLPSAEGMDNTGPFLVSCELNTWRLAGFTVGIHTDDVDPVSLTAGEFVLTIRAERDPVYYLLNFIAIMFGIVMANVTCLTMDPITNMGERLSVSVTLLLTAVSFKFVLADSLPQVGYQTLMDKYVLNAFFFLLMGLFWNLIVSPRVMCIAEMLSEGELDQCVLDKHGIVNHMDALFQISYLALWIAFNLFVAFLCSFPSILRHSWEKVDNNQIGDIAASLKRQKRVLDLDNPVPGTYCEESMKPSSSL